MKLLTTRETKDKFFWIWTQYMDRHVRRSIKSCEEVYAKLGQGEVIRIIEKTWPMISNNQEDVASILEGWNYKIDRYDRHLNLRSQFIVSKKNPATSIVTAPLLIVGILNLGQRLKLGLKRELSEKEFIVDLEDNWSDKVINPSEIDEAFADVERAKIEAERRKKNAFLDEFMSHSLDGGISSIMDFGGTGLFTKRDMLPEMIILVCFEMKEQGSKNEGLPTSRYIILDTKMAKKYAEAGNIVRIIIPTQYIGAVIGKNGERIRVSAEMLGMPISLH